MLSVKPLRRESSRYFNERILARTALRCQCRSIRWSAAAGLPLFHHFANSTPRRSVKIQTKTLTQEIPNPFPPPFPSDF